MTLTNNEAEIQQIAIEFARKNKKSIAKCLTDKNIFVSEENPVSVFMAGSPGAGKTEVSIQLSDGFSDDGTDVLRIDPDESRYSIQV